MSEKMPKARHNPKGYGKRSEGLAETCIRPWRNSQFSRHISKQLDTPDFQFLSHDEIHSMTPIEADGQ
jgi:hypothetical protein